MNYSLIIDVKSKTLILTYLKRKQCGFLKMMIQLNFHTLAWILIKKQA